MDRQHLRSPRCHAAQAQRGSAAPGARSGGIGKPRKEFVPRQDEPRDPHADERRSGDDGAVARNGAHERATQVRRDRAALGPESARHHQRSSGFLQDRGWKTRARERRHGSAPDARRCRGSPCRARPCQGAGACLQHSRESGYPRQGRPPASGPGTDQSGGQRDQVYRARLGRDPRGRPRGDRAERHAALRGQRHRCRHQRSSAIPHLRGVCPGRRINDPQARRLRPRPRDQQAARRNDGGEHLRRIRARRRFHVLVHQPLRKAGNARLACGPDGDAYGRAGAHRRIERHQWRHPSLADEQLGNEQSGRRNAGAGDRSACPGGGTKRSLRYCNHRPRAAGHGRARTRAHDQGPRRHRQAAAGHADSPPGGYAERTRRGHRRLPGQAGASDGAV